ncbi:hypothetical protein ACJ73_00739 [Blastomyces percursus]|uniref:Stress-associated endoplasmic reticulum protein n=1 Tax=Blastomyces percursus TaxID=1658174 RepID=A0A1J9QHB0_9EURO|nr:hypothetical protein ACJ73_00739 [Blastomyces percursus]
MKIFPVLFAFLTTSAIGQSLPPPTQADLVPSTQMVTNEAHPIPDISARGLGKFKDIFDKAKKKGGDKGAEAIYPAINLTIWVLRMSKNPEAKKPEDKIAKKKGKDKKKDEKELTENKTLSKKKFKFKSPKKSDGKSKGGVVVVSSMAPTGPKAPLLIIGGLFILAVPLMVH